MKYWHWMRNKHYLKLSKTAVIKLLETIQTALEETYNNIDLKTKTLFAHYEKF